MKKYRLNRYASALMHTIEEQRTSVADAMVLVRGKNEDAFYDIGQYEIAFYQLKSLGFIRLFFGSGLDAELQTHQVPPTYELGYKLLDAYFIIAEEQDERGVLLESVVHPGGMLTVMLTEDGHKFLLI